MDERFVLIATVLFFAATICKDCGYFPVWVKVVRIVAAVVIALNALAALL